MVNLETLVRDQLDDARASAHGRSAHLFVHDGPLRQTVIALLAGTSLDEHNAPPAASLQVLHGRVRLTGPGGGQVLTTGHVEALPHARHGLQALDDSVVLLTAVTEVRERARGVTASAAART
ncbi:MULTISPECIES: cupin domain-containing protein [unclassified Streptomyces]|uniref:cupin n=1 Tax=unclassified Streptomyces TaxID=2593676 RepID=UPI000C27A169|nr:cupin [Streptomyces sp. CB02959]PJN40649.1 cupin [Streptomyces sp. CB02959]